MKAASKISADPAKTSSPIRIRDALFSSHVISARPSPSRLLKVVTFCDPLDSLSRDDELELAKEYSDEAESERDRPPGTAVEIRYTTAPVEQSMIVALCRSAEVNLNNIVKKTCWRDRQIMKVVKGSLNRYGGDIYVKI